MCRQFWSICALLFSNGLTTICRNDPMGIRDGVQRDHAGHATTVNINVWEETEEKKNKTKRQITHTGSPLDGRGRILDMVPRTSGRFLLPQGQAFSGSNALWKVRSCAETQIASTARATRSSIGRTALLKNSAAILDSTRPEDERAQSSDSLSTNSRMKMGFCRRCILRCRRVRNCVFFAHLII